MKQRSRLASGGRIAVVSLTLGGYGWLLYSDAVGTFSASVPPFAPLPHMEITYGFSAFIGFTYLAVGLLVSLYIRERALGAVLLVFCCAMAAAFAVETATLASNAPTALALIADLGSGTGLLLFAVLPLLFPHNYLSRHGAGARRFLPALYLSLLALLYVLDLAADPYIVTPLHLGWQALPAALSESYNDALAAFYLTAGFATLLITHRRRRASARERLQVKLVAGGTLLAFLPFIVLTLLLSLLSSPYAADPQFSTLPFVLMPIALGYAILRYHLLTPDRYIRYAVTLLVGCFCLALGAYLIFLFSVTTPKENQSLQTLSAAVLMLLLILIVWLIAPRVTERVFAPDLAAAHRLLYGVKAAPVPPSIEPASPGEAVRQFLSAARSLFGTRQACFLVYHRERASLGLMQEETESPSRTLLSHVLAVMGIQSDDQDWLDAREPLVARLAAARRPLLLSEAQRAHPERQTRLLKRFLVTSMVQEDPLLVPVKTQGGALLGILLLGRRDYLLPYAGPDFAVIDLLLSRFSALLETALATRQRASHVEMLTLLSSIPPTGTREPSELAQAYAAIAAQAVKARAEVWLYDGHLLRRTAQAGVGPPLPHEGSLKPREAGDWLAWFYAGASEPRSGRNEQQRPTILEPPDFPFAWLPLQGGRPLGVLVLTYAHPYHLFVDAERQILELFARLLSTALEKAYIAEETLAASCRLREQSRLDLQQLLQALQRLMEPLAGIGRSVELLLSTTPPAFLEEPRPPRSPLAHSSYEEVLACLDVSLQRSLGVLGELARRQEATPGGRAGLADVIRQQVNEILSRFDSLRVLVITPDGELFAMLAWALSIAGYTPVRIDSCQQVTACVREGMDQGHTPALLILDPAALLDVSLVDFHTALQTGCDIALPLLLLETGDPRTQGWPNRYALQAPFTVHSLLGAVQACAHGFGDPST